MFFPNSRYLNAGTYQVTLPNGSVVTATHLPLPRKSPLLGFHRRHEGQRIDLVANYYLKDPTAFWRLCDASGSIAPDALAARELVAIPAKER
jgi:hypothetical protein